MWKCVQNGGHFVQRTLVHVPAQYGTAKNTLRIIGFLLFLPGHMQHRTPGNIIVYYMSWWINFIWRNVIQWMLHHMHCGSEHFAKLKNIFSHDVASEISLKTDIFSQEDALENLVCKMSAILFRLQHVKSTLGSCSITHIVNLSLNLSLINIYTRCSFHYQFWTWILNLMGIVSPSSDSSH